MDDECGDLQKAIAEVPMVADEGPLINENSNGLSHLLTEGEFNSVDAVGVDESSASNQGFLNAVELSTGSVGDYLENNSNGFNAGTFDVGDNAVTFPNDSINATMSGSRDTAYMEAFDAECEFVEAQNKMETDNEADGESNDMNNVPTLDNTPDRSEDVSLEPIDQATIEQIDEVSSDQPEDFSDKLEQQILDDQPEDSSDKLEQQILDAQPEDSSDKLETVSQEKLDKLEQQLLDDQPEDSIDKMESQDKLDKLEDVSQDKFDKNEQQNFKEVSKQEVTEISQSNHEETCEKNIIPKENKSDNVAKVLGAEETEVVSEDELPTVEKPSIKDAENVSDDELPGPKPADLPADTEVVSEDELPTSKKEAKETRKRKPEAEGDGYSPGSPTSESESASKKQAVVKNGESKPVPAEKRPSTDEKQKKKALPELDKYWKVVNDDPTDFTGWTYLLQYVDQESDVEASREAYDAFLSHYPYCYGYWRKYADYEKRKGSKKKCLEVLERGLKSIPLSVDLWIHYLNHVKTTRTEEHAYIRSQYERAIEACGLEFRSDRLWESYIKWEAENGSALNVTNIYDRLLATPTLGYTSHFDNFQEHVMSEPVSGVIGKEELIKLRAEVRAAGGTVPQLDLPPGEDEPADHVASEEEGQAIKERIIAARRKVHKTTGEEVASRWTFEEGIKRPYFHVKPLERCQLKNWKSYLEWEKQHGTFKRALVLHERCLIACALYDEFWMRLVKFLEERSESSRPLVNLEREVLERACTVHHLDKHELHMYWAHFEEAHGNAAKAADILERIEKACPQVVQIQYRRVNLERRRGDYDKCCQLYEAYISGAKSKQVASALAVKYARFLSHVRAQPGEARRVLDEAVARDPLNARLHLQRLDLALHQPATPYAELEELVTSYEKQEGSEAEVSAEFAWRRRELAEELGDAAAARTAAAHQRALARHLRKRARKEKHDSLPSTPAVSSDTKKKDSTSVAAAVATTTASNSGTYYQTPATNSQGYDQQYAQGYQPPPWGYQQPPGPYQHHPHPWPQYPNYY